MQDPKPLLVTTPIFYVNDRPHIGHAYAATIADVCRRYGQLRGRPTCMVTGTDEHGQKVAERAKSEGLAPQEFVDRMSPRFREMAATLGVGFDHFIRTTDARHRETVARLWQRLVDRGDIYLGSYEGWYSVSEETFLTEKELLEGNLCPYSKQPARRVSEPSYFFRLSAYQDRLLDFYRSHPDFILPKGRYTEMVRFVEGGLRDLSVSRTSFRWGIGVPGAPEHVVYVWLDALANYLSAIGGLSSSDEDAASGTTSEASPVVSAFWPPSGEALHVVGKDILRFHAIYWPAFLMSAGIEPPTRILAHGWLTVDGEKMSKSRGNFVPPEPLAQLLGEDALRYCLLRDIALGSDGDFSHERLLDRYQSELASGLGNLASRILVSLVQKVLGGAVPAPTPSLDTDAETALREAAARCAQAARTAYEEYTFHRAIEAIWELVAEANRYVDKRAPWTLKAPEQHAELGNICYHVLEVLRMVSVLVTPVMPRKAGELRDLMGLPPLTPTPRLDLWPEDTWGGLQPGLKVNVNIGLFPRLDPAVVNQFKPSTKADSDAPPSSTGPANTSPKQGKPMNTSAAKALEKTPTAATAASSPKGASGAADKDAEETTSALIDFDDFAKVDLRVGRVLSAETMPKSDKLLRLKVDIGEAEPRQILAGIRQFYAPEALVGQALLVVANLKPRKMMGEVSQGMVLAVKDGTNLGVLNPTIDAPPGTRAS